MGMGMMIERFMLKGRVMMAEIKIDIVVIIKIIPSDNINRIIIKLLVVSLRSMIRSIIIR